MYKIYINDTKIELLPSYKFSKPEIEQEEHLVARYAGKNSQPFRAARAVARRVQLAWLELAVASCDNESASSGFAISGVDSRETNHLPG